MHSAQVSKEYKSKIDYLNSHMLVSSKITILIKGTYFCEYYFLQGLRSSGDFAKLNTCEIYLNLSFTKINTREISENRPFAIHAKKSISWNLKFTFLNYMIALKYQSIIIVSFNFYVRTSLVVTLT